MTLLMLGFRYLDMGGLGSKRGLRPQSLRWSSSFVGWLCLFVALEFTFVTASRAAAQTTSDIGPNTIELRSDQLKFQIIPKDAPPPAGFEQPGFDESEFSTAPGPFGSGGNCPLQPTVATNWPINTQLLVRRVVSLPDGAENVRILLSVDNDIRGVFFNGARISGPVRHDFCPIKDEFRFDIPQSLVRPGENLLAFDVSDRGVESFFDQRVLAEVTADQLSEAVVVQQAPLVPVRDATAACSVGLDANGVPVTVTTIPYAVAATGEFGEIRVEQILEQKLTLETLLGGEQTAFVDARPDTTTVSRSTRAIESVNGLDPGIASIPSVMADQSVLDDMIRCNAAPVASSCENVCKRGAAIQSILSSLSSISSSSSSLSPFDAPSLLAGANRLQRLGDLLRECLAGCMQTPPVPPRWCLVGDPLPCPQPPPRAPAGTLKGYYIYNCYGVPGAVGYCTPTVRFSGKLLQPAQQLEQGMTSFQTDVPGGPVAPSISGTTGSVGPFVEKDNLAAGTWSITAASQRSDMTFGPEEECPPVTVPVGGGSGALIHIDVTKSPTLCY